MPRSNRPATLAGVRELSTVLALDEDTQRRAMELAGVMPGKSDWLRYLDRFLVTVGTLLVVAGIIAFFAWNWAELHRLVRLALIQGGLLGSVVLAWRLGMDTPAGRAGLLAAAVLVGVVLAVYGQVYQTGADPYGLFLAWALLILPWVLIGRQAGLWLLLLLLLNLTVILYWIQVLHPPPGWWQLTQLLGPLVWLGSSVMDWRLASWLFALNAVAVFAWEFFSGAGPSWLRGRMFPRAAALIALYTVLGPTLVLIFAASVEFGANVNVVSPLLFAGVLAVCLWYYQFRRPDLFILTAAIFSVILLVMALAVRYLFDDADSLLVLAMLLIVQVAGAALWLRKLTQRLEFGS